MNRTRLLLLIVLLVATTFQSSCEKPSPAQPKEYLLVTLEWVYIKDSTDSGGEGEITIWTLVESLDKKGERISGSLSQGNAFPHPSRYWVEMSDGESFYPRMPIYYAPWDETPDELFFFVTAWDNDEGPKWINDGIEGLGEILQDIGSGAEDIATYLLSLPAEQLEKLIGKDWFISQITHYIWKEVLKKADLYSIVSAADRYSPLVKAMGEITSLWGKHIKAPQTVFTVAYRSSELHDPDRARPTKKTDWGGVKNGQPVEFYLCNQASLLPGGDCGETVASLKFYRISEPEKPVIVDVTLKSIYLYNNREGKDAEIFIHTRYADQFTRVTEIPGAPAEVQGKYQFQGDAYFLTTDKRLPASGFNNFADNVKYPIWQLISSSTRTPGKPPFFYVEVDLYEDDSGAIFEDELDWLGTFTWLIITQNHPRNKMFCPASIQEYSQYAKVEICITISDAATSATPTAQPTPLPPISPPVPATYYLGFNTSLPPFDNAGTRQAFASLIDKEYLLERIGREGREVATSFVHPSIWPAGFSSYNEIGLPFDPEAAYTLASDLGSDGDLAPVDTIILGTSDDKNAVQVAEFIKESWESYFGLGVEIVTLDWDSYVNYLRSEDPPNAYLIGWKADYRSPYNFLYDVFNSQSASNHARYQNPYYDTLLTEAWNEANPGTQLQKYLEAERILCEQDAVIVPLYYYFEDE